MAENTTPHTEGERTTIVTPRRLFQPREEAYKYKLEAPTFTGIEDVDQFMQNLTKPWPSLNGHHK